MNIKLKVNQIRVDNRSIDRTITVETSISYPKYFAIPINFSGVLIMDGKVLGALVESTNHVLKYKLELLPLDQAKIRSRNYDYDTFNVNYTCRISDKALAYIEQSRIENSKGDVNFTTKFCCKLLSTNLKPSLPREQFDLLSCEQMEVVADYQIPRSTWIQDFSENLGIGKILIIEHNQERLKTVFEDLLGIVPEKIRESIDRSLELLSLMEDSLREGNWKEVLRYAREFFELIRFKGDNKTKEEMRAYYKERNGSEIGFDELYKGIQLLHSYLSKFIHQKTQQGQLYVKPTAQQEDAYFIYTLCNSLIYLILNKLRT